MELPDYEEFFREYANTCERSLGGSVDVAAIRRFFAEAFVSASVAGDEMAIYRTHGLVEETGQPA